MHDSVKIWAQKERGKTDGGVAIGEASQRMHIGRSVYKEIGIPNKMEWSRMAQQSQKTKDKVSCVPRLKEIIPI